MNVLLISQCNKNALPQTRRILDNFAERKGARAWQTSITQAGLNTLRKLLRKTARRNTAVACHWIKKANKTELLWIVGNAAKFNDQGTIPTNTTRRNILRTESENSWNTIEDISIIAGLAGLFHDFGKANDLFQKKLTNRKSKKTEPFRHEWVSLRLFQAFVSNKTDEVWLNELLSCNKSLPPKAFESLIKDTNKNTQNPFKEINQPLAQIIAWLIVSHHRMLGYPPYVDTSKDKIKPPKLKNAHKWMVSAKLGPFWNSPQFKNPDWDIKDFQDVWKFKKGIPVASSTWQNKAKSLARRALKSLNLLQRTWLEDFFSIHLARLALMMADHTYSSREPEELWQSPKCKLFANTDRKTKEPKQKLDEHLIGVAHNSVLFAKSLPNFRKDLPAITRHKGLTKRNKNSLFRWQDKAYELAVLLQEKASVQGFFGVNMASTGAGKTFANARIMYGLASEKLGCRFNIALGLRTLTLQTGDAIRERLHLQEDDLGVLVGSSAVKQLHNLRTEKEKFNDSESIEELFDPNQYVAYEGSLFQGRFNSWFRQNPNLHRLVSAPVLVSTIDYLMPATESFKGGHQIAPMLRLLSSDLVLDEPDDFNLEDLPALTRLANWAGMLGSKLLLSSATLPPDFIKALFEAYLSGRKAFQNSCGEPGIPLNICCAWFDENRIENCFADSTNSFMETHESFVEKRIENLQKTPVLRKNKILPLEANSLSAQKAISVMADTIHENIFKLHSYHNQHNENSGHKISIGLIRMSNINPLVAVARELFSKNSLPDHIVHFAIYHSKHPLAVRSDMEEKLDEILNRKNQNTIWKNPKIQKCLKYFPEKNHIFVVIATSVAEVGRDHDYDWAIVEPSSMRSIIQLAGRIQRHRKQSPQTSNMLTLSKNFKGLTGEEISFNKPGFESKDYLLKDHDLANILDPEQFEIITAIPRIKKREILNQSENLVDLEHAHLHAKLFGYQAQKEKDYAAVWWQNNVSWCYEMQRRLPFRKSTKDQKFILYFEEEGDSPKFNLVEDDGTLTLRDKSFERIKFEAGDRVYPWFNNDFTLIAIKLMQRTGLCLEEISMKFGEIRIQINETENLKFDPLFGIFKEIK